jgi:GNAT superfamily N-acetyltransferase
MILLLGSTISWFNKTCNLSSSRFKQVPTQDTILVAEAEGRMVGFVHSGMADGYPETNSERDWAVHKLYVLANYQNRVIGSLLMDVV